MVKVKLGDEVVQSKIKFKVRFDFRGEYKPGRFLFGGKSMEQSAQDTRDEQITLLKNIPLQGIYFEDYDISAEPYIIFDENLNERVAFAPAFLTVNADSIEDMVKFIMREEFRKLEIIEPPQMLITNKDLERILFKMNEEFKNQLLLFSKKIKK
ncbi:MAG: hypothetical protein NUV45_06555 [Tepidanaerobacteraceae bacterium]|jgi:hypothetical protein|nr:hypothetical protein [Tepidanaerobacteraceae bacterium]